jgi:PleD family two-component response regulator
MAKFSSQENNGHEPQSGTCIDLSTIPRNELRICIAEDNAINQRIAISFVQKLGFKCDAYLDGFKTIDALERASDNGRPFHLVLMDVQMPHCDGYEGTSVRRDERKSLKHIREQLARQCCEHLQGHLTLSLVFLGVARWFTEVIEGY